MSLTTSIQLPLRLARPLIWKALREQPVGRMMGMFATSVDRRRIRIQRDENGKKFFNFDPWHYFAKVQKWEGERQEGRAGWKTSIRVPIDPYHSTESVDADDWEDPENIPADEVLTPQEITRAMMTAYHRDQEQFVLEAIAANEILGYDAEPTFSNNHSDIKGESGKRNIAVLGVDLPARTLPHKPTTPEIYEEVSALADLLSRNRVAITRFQLVEPGEQFAAIVRSIETKAAFRRLNSAKEITYPNGSKIANEFQGAIRIIDDLEPGTIDSNTYEMVDLSAELRLFMHSLVKPVRKLDVDDQSFHEQKIYLGIHYSAGQGPGYWQQGYRAQPAL